MNGLCIHECVLMTVCIHVCGHACFFFSVKFGKKLMYVNYLVELKNHLPFDQLTVPQPVLEWVCFLLHECHFCWHLCCWTSLLQRLLLKDAFYEEYTPKSLRYKSLFSPELWTLLWISSKIFLKTILFKSLISIWISAAQWRKIWVGIIDKHRTAPQQRQWCFKEKKSFMRDFCFWTLPALGQVTLWVLSIKNLIKKKKPSLSH